MYMAKLATVAAFSLVLLIGAIYTLESHIAAAPEASPQAAYFMQRLDALAVEMGNGQRPIEGWTPTLLMERFPGLLPQDFDGAETYDGHLYYRDGALAFEDGSATVSTSAAESLTQSGFATLLANLSTRLDAPAETNAHIDSMLAALASSDAPAAEAHQGRITLEAKLGESVSAFGVTITPKEVLEDSRCPKGVQCIWAGRVRVLATLSSGLGTADQEFTLGDAVTTEAEEIAFASVTPAPLAGVEIRPEQYRFTFEVRAR
jgi:hypothetical protein